MSIVVRELSLDDAAQAQSLGEGIFRAPPPFLSARPGMRWFGAFDGDRLVAQAIDREYDSWFGGVAVPTSGIAYVGVSPSHRGRGLVRQVMDAALSSAVDDRGVLISTLFPAAPKVYRGLGYERITDLLKIHVQVSDLTDLAARTSTTTRPATVEDLPAIRSVYDQWASQQNGPLTRTGSLFTDPDLPATTVAVDADDRVTGYASLRRREATPEVRDLLALEADAYRALLHALANLAEPTFTLRTSGDDPVRLLLPTSDWQITASTPYMLRVLQVDAALSRRAYAPGVSADLAFTLDGISHQLSVRDGAGECWTTDGGGVRTLTPQGLASLYAGAQSCSNLRSTGNLHGGDRGEDAMWDALFGGQQAHILDYF